MKKISRFITFVTFMSAGVGLILTSLFLQDDFMVVVTLCFALATVTIVAGVLDPHLNQKLRITIIIIGFLFAVAAAVGLILQEGALTVSTYCLIFAILEIINGIAELNEGVGVIKEKNYVMGVLFIVDAVIEIVLGILMSIERHETLRTHVILIAADLFFEGIIKLINEYVEERKGIQHE